MCIQLTAIGHIAWIVLHVYSSEMGVIDIINILRTSYITNTSCLQSSEKDV